MLKKERMLSFFVNVYRIYLYICIAPIIPCCFFYGCLLSIWKNIRHEKNIFFREVKKFPQ